MVPTVSLLNSEASKIVLDYDNVYFWVILGCSLGVVAAVSVIVAVWFYFRRKTKKQKHPESVPELPLPSDSYQFQFPQPSFASSGSDDATDPPFPYLPSSSRRSTLTQSVSLDTPSTVHLTSECVQPRPVLTKWHTIGSPTYLGTVQPDLYRGSDDDELSNIPPTNGRVWFSLLYKEEDEQLEINLIRAKYLPGRGLNNTPRDPYVKIYLLPDEENFQQSKVRKRTLAPKFHETFMFQVKKDEIRERTLRFSMYDVDKRKVRHSLGHVIVPLSRVDLTNNDIQWRDLETTTQPCSLGEIKISLSCNPITNRIKVTICRLRDIKGIDSGEAGVYTKIQLHHGRKTLKTKRTTLKHLNFPEGEVIFDESFTFAVTGKYFDSFHLTLTAVVAGPTPLVKDDPQGQVVLGPFLYARGEQLLHWQEMIANSRNTVTRWHHLEPIV